MANQSASDIARQLFAQLQQRAAPAVQTAVSNIKPVFAGVTQGINSVGKFIGQQPFINTPLIKSPTNLQVAQTVTPIIGQKNNPTTSFLTGNVQKIPSQIATNVNQQYGLPQKRETQQQYIQRSTNSLSGAINFGFAKPALSKAADYLAKTGDREAVRKITDFIIHVQKTGGKKNYGPAGQEIQAMATDIFGQNARNLNNAQLANLFDATLKSVGQKGKFGLGLGTENVRGNQVSNRKGMDSLTTPQIENVQQTKGNQIESMPQIDTQNISSNGSGNIVSGSGTGSSGRSIAQTPNSENPYFNTNRINVKPEAKQLINKTLQEVKPQIEQVVGKKLSNREVINTANTSAKILRKVVDRQQTSDFETALLNTRQKLAAMSESGTVDKDYLDTLITLKSHATDIGRKLQSFSINADPKNVTAKNAIMEAVTKVEKDSNKILEAAKGVDFNDYNQATNFYRKFIKPSVGEWTDTLRYNSMLSSPNTHINNAFSNLLNTSVVAPIEKTITGGVDFLKSAVTGKQRQAFAGEGATYAKGYAQSLREASHRFVDSLRGKAFSGNLDTRSIPLAQKGVKGIVEKTLSFPTKLLEASDQFFTTLTAGGEKAALELRKSKGVNVGNIETKAADSAAYRLFRSELGDSKQGHVLDGIDKVTGLVQQARTSDNKIVSTIAKFTLPFVRTPMNILKQGIEYSPAGILTLPGAKNKTEQLSKILIGSSAVAATAMLASSGRTTWALPTDEKEKQAFYAAGMQPYSVKIGDKWVSYSKLPPAISFNIALVAAIHDAQEKKQLDDGQVETILDGVAKWGNFFADQSYLKNIGDFVAMAKGDKIAISQAISNYPQQLIPFRALSGWVARTLDPYMRKVDPGEDFLHKQIDLIKTQIPGLSQQVTPRLDERGNPVPNSNRFINAVSPARITSENPQGKARYDIRKTELKANAYFLPLKQDIQSQADDITSRMTTDIFNKIVADHPELDQQTQNKLYDRLHSKISTKTKRVILVKNAAKIKELLDNLPKNNPQELRVYLEKMKSSGLLTKDTIQAITGSQQQ